MDEPEGEIIYGTESQFEHSKTWYPLLGGMIKFIPTKDGLYIKYDLWFEWPKYYKPIKIPWSNLLIYKSNEFDKVGFDRYQIYSDSKYLGQIKIQPYISSRILEFIKKGKLAVQII